MPNGLIFLIRKDFLKINACGKARQILLISYDLCDDAQPILFFRSLLPYDYGNRVCFFFF